MTCSICDDVVCHGGCCNREITTADGVTYKILHYVEQKDRPGRGAYRLLSPLGNTVVMTANQFVDLIWPNTVGWPDANPPP